MVIFRLETPLTGAKIAIFEHLTLSSMTARLLDFKLATLMSKSLHGCAPKTPFENLRLDINSRFVAIVAKFGENRTLGSGIKVISF